MGLFSNKSSGIRKSRLSLQIALCESSRDVGDNVPFRLLSDADNVVRIRQSYPVGSDGRFSMHSEEWELPVAGVSYRLESVTSFIAGQARNIQLVQEPTAEYPHAIAVYGAWNAIGGEGYREKLGYIPDDDAKGITATLKRTPHSIVVGRLSTMFLPYDDKSPGLRIEVAIFVPAVPRFEIHGFGRENGRKRKRTYSARDLDEAIDKASKDGIVVDVGACKQLGRT